MKRTITETIFPLIQETPADESVEETHSVETAENYYLVKANSFRQIAGPFANGEAAQEYARRENLLNVDADIVTESMLNERERVAKKRRTTNPLVAAIDAPVNAEKFWYVNLYDGRDILNGGPFDTVEEAQKFLDGADKMYPGSTNDWALVADSERAEMQEPTDDASGGDAEDDEPNEDFDAEDTEYDEAGHIDVDKARLDALRGSGELPEKLAALASAYGEGIDAIIQHHGAAALLPYQQQMVEAIEAGPDSAIVETIAHAEGDDEEGMDANMAGMTREAALAEIRRYYTLVDTKRSMESISKLDDISLFEHLHLLRSNYGPDIDTAAVLREVEVDYRRFLNSDRYQSALGNINKRSADYVKVVQRLERSIGSDVVLQGMRAKEPYEALKQAIKYITTVTDGIFALAEKMGITVPADELLPNSEQVAIVEGLPADPRLALYVLSIFHSQINKQDLQLEVSARGASDLLNKVEQLKKAEARSRDEAAAARAAVAAEQKARQEQFANAVGWIIRDSAGRYLRKIDEDTPLRTANDLDLRGTAATALELSSRNAAKELVDRLSRTLRFKKYALTVYRVSVTEEV